MIGSKKRLIGSNAPISMPSGSATAEASRNAMTMRRVEIRIGAPEVVLEEELQRAAQHLGRRRQEVGLAIGCRRSVSTHQATEHERPAATSANGDAMRRGSALAQRHSDSRHARRPLGRQLDLLRLGGRRLRRRPRWPYGELGHYCASGRP